jgi:cell wall-associated NlpC family hydrolase
MLNYTKRRIAKKIAFSFLGKPYIWGGDDPIAGFDCSGEVIEILKSIGILPRKGDWTAEGLWNRFGRCEVKKPYNGCLVFWTNRSGKISHVEYAINRELCIGASGGGSKTKTIEDAIKQNAYIKIRPWRSREEVKGFVDPFKLKNS